MPGCPELTADRKCDAHLREARDAYEATRGSAQERGYDSRWSKTSKAFLAVHDICSVPGCLRPATDADHIDGLGPLGPRGHDWSNLRPFCHPHHSQRTARDQGGWHRTAQRG